MALDVQKLTPTEAVRLLNSSPLGTVISAATLHRQMNKAGFRIGDGKTIHLVRYVKWLAAEYRRPKPEPMTYEERKRREAERNRLKALAGQDIGPVPDVADVGRRDAASAGFRVFCETYFPPVFYRPWSADHLRVIEKMERCIQEGGLFAFAMPRGSGKTTLARLAALWAVLTGARHYVCLIGGSQTRAIDLLASIRRSILSPECEALRADFPEALYPLWCLRNNARKQKGQHIDGELTYCTWASDKLVFPTVTDDRLPGMLRDRGLEQSPSNSSVITVTSLDSNMRGQQHTRMDGSVIRPSLVLLDDPQTRESARSPAQTKYRLDLLNGDVLGMAGPGEKIAAFLACTKMYEDDLADQVLDLQKNPQWQGECTKLISAWPTNEKLWDEYRTIREESLRQGNGGKEATKFYREHRAEMDEGAQAAWSARFNEDEISAIQHAVNLRCDMGDEAFDAEYQNEPASKQETEAAMIAPDDVAERFNGRKRGEVPLACSKVTGFIDVHKQLLFYCVCAWQEDFTGFVIDYGTFPDQGRSFFTLANARRTLGRTFKGAGEEGAIQAGLEKLVSELLEREWPKAGGAGVMRIERLFVDMGYKPRVVAAVKHKVGGSAMMLSKGVGIKAGGKPVSMYQRRPGWTLGTNWYVPNVRGTAEFPHICVDVNWWKSFVHERLAVAPGDPGALTLFGKKAVEHHLFAEHIAGSETYVTTFGHGRQVHQWRQRPERPDNHWFDCLVGCAAA
ncbi:MAG: terminase gpA endonuclease subunit, partial [Planctomycetota bacterium]